MFLEVYVLEVCLKRVCRVEQGVELDDYNLGSVLTFDGDLDYIPNRHAVDGKRDESKPSSFVRACSDFVRDPQLVNWQGDVISGDSVVILTLLVAATVSAALRAFLLDRRESWRTLTPFMHRLRIEARLPGSSGRPWPSTVRNVNSVAGIGSDVYGWRVSDADRPEKGLQSGPNLASTQPRSFPTDPG